METRIETDTKIFCRGEVTSPGRGNRTPTEDVVKKILNEPVLFLIRFYRKVISPCLPNSCRFEPTCSVYALKCFERFGFFQALFYTTKRILRCHPFCKGGFDPVPADFCCRGEVTSPGRGSRAPTEGIL